MLRLKRFRILITSLVFAVLLSSCFKDVDLGQAENIQLTPDVEIDLLYYQLNESDFIDSQTTTFTPLIRDTVRLEFLDDDYIQDGLVSAAFRFKHENSFLSPIASRIRFLDKNARQQFTVDYIIPAGTTAAPAILDTVYVREGSAINQVKRSIQVVLELDLMNSGENIKGELDFSSKGLFKFEF